ncbi:uncharacterized protein LOC126778544 isoform X2 [Nymphalis io]|uniref:uncharacterized protein LOC126778544 isoform X2 n=1 Tax=Inachis io TaxID=171585 RepID=UPI002168EBB0|nr:uncharacterized protein LOC126778544 isoform X2 [Nymphalis io]
MNNKICFVIFYTSTVLHLVIVAAFQPENTILNKLKDEENYEEKELAETDEENDERNEIIELDESNEFDEPDDENDGKNESAEPDDESDGKNELLKADESDASLDDMLQEAKAVGDYADLFGTNQHYSIPDTYQDFGRRFVLSYPYFEKTPIAKDAAETELDNAIKQHLEAKKISDRRLLPHKAPPEFVLAVAKQSANLESMKPKKNINKYIRKDILRTGDYWDDVWKEDVDVNNILRSSNKNQNELESVSVEISPGSKLYDLISILQQKSPRLLYVINKRNDK